MMTNIILIYILFSAFSLSSYADGFPRAKNYSEAKALADISESKPEAKENQNSKLIPYFGKKYANVLKMCFESVDNPDSSTFNMVILLLNDGTVDTVYRDNETNIFNCISKELEIDKFPEPISNGYYLHIEMSFT